MVSASLPTKTTSPLRCAPGCGQETILLKLVVQQAALRSEQWGAPWSGVSVHRCRDDGRHNHVAAQTLLVQLRCSARARALHIISFSFRRANSYKCLTLRWKNRLTLRRERAFSSYGGCLRSQIFHHGLVWKLLFLLLCHPASTVVTLQMSLV